MKQKSHDSATTTLKNAPMPPEVFYIAHVAEEVGGRPVAISPLKIMNESPSALGVKVAHLIMQRYPGADTESLETMARVKLLTVTLKSSYLLIKLEYPPEHVYAPNRLRAFGQFSAGVRTGFLERTKDEPLIRRRRKPDLAAF